MHKKPILGYHKSAFIPTQNSTFIRKFSSCRKVRETGTKRNGKNTQALKLTPIETDGVTIKAETKLYKKVPPYEMRMDLDSMIKKIEKKHILTIDHNIFPALKKLRELRNRVHLQTGRDAYDHDYNSIGFNEIQMMRRILYAILTTPEICNNSARFEFINASYTDGL